MSESLQVQAPYRAKVYTLKEIDDQLDFGRQLLVYGDKTTRKVTLKIIDEWLDKRIELTG